MSRHALNRITDVVLVLLPILAPLNVFSQEFLWQRAPGSEGVSASNLAFYHEDPDSMYAAGSTKLLVSADRGMSWDSIGPGICCGVIDVDPFNSQRLFLNETGLPFKGNVIHVSTDQGSTWSQLGLGHCTKLKGCATPFFNREPTNPQVLYTVINPVFIIRTMDNANTWDTLPSPVELNLQSFQIASDGITLFAAYGKPIRVFRSLDRGEHWIEMGSPTPGVESNIVIAVDPANPDLLHAGIAGRGMFRSSDAGGTWFESNTGLPDELGEILSILINPLNTDEVFIGMVDDDPFDGASDLVYVSVDGGDEWSRLTPGLPHHGAVSWLSIDPDQFRLFAAVSSKFDEQDSSGIYIFEAATGVEHVPDPSRLPSAILDQNYPNPFNTKSKIRIRIREAGNASLKVYNILGNEVGTLVDGYLPVGEHRYKWDAALMPSGVYFYRLVSGKTSQTRRMVLLK